jgi:hypothetical protein
MEQLVKRIKDFEIFGAQSWHRKGEHRNSKAAVILARCAILKPANAPFRIMLRPADDLVTGLLLKL